MERSPAMGESSTGGAEASPLQSLRRPCRTCRGATVAASRKENAPARSAANGQRNDDPGSARETSILRADSAARACSRLSSSVEAPRGGSRDSSTLDKSSDGPPKSRASSRGSRPTDRCRGERSEKKIVAAAEKSAK